LNPVTVVRLAAYRGTAGFKIRRPTGTQQ